MLINRFYYSRKHNKHHSYTRYKKISPNLNIQPRNNHQLDKQQSVTNSSNNLTQQQQYLNSKHNLYLHSSIPKHNSSLKFNPFLLYERLPFHSSISSNVKSITSHNLWDTTQSNVNVHFPEVYNNINNNINTTNQSKQNIFNNEKPQTASEMKLPEERLKKGQNQLILERLQEKFASKLMSNNFKKTQTGSWFYKKKKSMSLRQIEKFGKQKNNHSSYISNHSKKFNNKEYINVINKNIKKVNKNENEIRKNISSVESPFNSGNGMKGSFIRTIAKDFGFKRNKNVVCCKGNLNLCNRSLDEIDIINNNNIHNRDNNNNNYKSTTNVNSNFNSNINTIFSPQETIKISPMKPNNKHNQYNNTEQIDKHNKSAINLNSNYELSLNKDFSFSKIVSIHKHKSKAYHNNSNNNNNINSNTNKKEFTSKTSFHFFKPSSNISSNTNNNNNINTIINRVLESNFKAASMKTSNFFNEINRGFMNNQMRRTNNSFYKPKPHPKKHFNINSSDKDFIKQHHPQTLNFLQLTLLTPLKWKQHEEIWTNISQLSSSFSEFEIHLLPPNETDVLISCYLKLHPSLLNFCSFSNIISSSHKQVNYLSFNIDDNIKNPRNEIKKWKDAYKLSVHRWHPDKLFPLLNEIKLKDENIKQLLKKKSNTIINNMNNLYKQIIEILRKVNQAKHSNENNINI